MKSLISTCAAIAAVACLGAGTAQADSHHGHNHGHNHGSTFSSTGGYSYSPSSYYPNQSTYVTYPSYPSYPRTTFRPPRRTAVWHDTTHVDVTPGRWVYGPNGATYIPPRRVLHVDGHVDYVPTHNHNHYHP